MTYKKNKESFLALSSFLIIGLFSFSIGCSKIDPESFSDQNPHLSFSIKPLNNSGADHQVKKLIEEEKDFETSAASKLTLSSKVEKLDLLSQLNPFLQENSNLATLQQPSSEDTDSDESSDSNPCNVNGLNIASEIIQLDSVTLRGGETRTTTALDYAAHAYLEAEFQDCEVLRFIEDFYNSETHRTKSTDVEGREVNKIAHESGTREQTATWVKEEETQEIQVRVYTSNERTDEKAASNHRHTEAKTGVDIINDRGDGSFKKWIHLVNKLDIKENALSSYNPYTVQRMFFLYQEPENEEPSHIVGSIRFRDDAGEANDIVTLGLSKLVKESGAVVYFVKELTNKDTAFNTACTLTLETNYYGPTGEELSAGDELTQLKEKLGDHAISDLASKLPEESLKTIVTSLGANSPTTLAKCGFTDIDSILKVKDADDFEFAEPQE